MEERDEGVTVAQIASLHHTSVPSLYRWRAHALDALLDAPPGPAPADAELRALREENARLRAPWWDELLDAMEREEVAPPARAA
jgi:transposase-like protein